MKTCNKCGQTKEFSEFHKSISKKDGLNPQCKECRKKHNIELKTNLSLQLKKEIISSVRLENKILIKENKKLCTRCKQIFKIENINSSGKCINCGNESSKEWKQINKEKVNNKQKVYRDTHKEIVKESAKKWYEKNKETKSLKGKEYREKNKENLSSKRKEWEEKNKEHRKKYLKEYSLKKKLEKLSSK